MKTYNGWQDNIYKSNIALKNKIVVSTNKLSPDIIFEIRGESSKPVTASIHEDNIEHLITKLQAYKTDRFLMGK